MNFSSFSKKALVTALLALSATGLAYAKGGCYKGEANYKGEVPAPCPVPCQLKDGFYVGAQVGYDSFRVREELFRFTTPFHYIEAHPLLNVLGPVGGLFIGYGDTYQIASI